MVVLQLADQSVKRPRGVVEDVLVQIEKFYYPVDFLILDTKSVVHANSKILIILGRPFLATVNALINCGNGLMKLSFGHMTLEVNIFNIGKQLVEDDECEVANWIDVVVEDQFHNTYFSDPLESCIVNSYNLDSSINSEIIDVCSSLDDFQVMEISWWRTRFEELPKSEIKPLPSSIEVPKLELKQLPSEILKEWSVQDKIKFFVGILEEEQVMVAKKLPRSKKKSLHAYSDAPKLELKQQPKGLICGSLKPRDPFTVDVPLKLSVGQECEIIKFFERHKTKRKSLHDRILLKKLLNTSRRVNLHASRMSCARRRKSTE